MRTKLKTDTNVPQRPMTRALKRLIDYKNAATMAISILHEDFNALWGPDTFAKEYTKFCCDKCNNAINTTS